MALSLTQANAVSRDQIARGVMQVFTMNSFVLDRLAFEDIEGTAFKYFQESALPGAEFRAVNPSYAESTGTVTSATEGLVILGGDAVVDRFLQLTRSDIIDPAGHAGGDEGPVDRAQVQRRVRQRHGHL